MESFLGPIDSGSAGGPPGTGRPPSRLNPGERSDEIFERELTRAAERPGGREALEERSAGLREERRAERHAGFGQERAVRRPPREAEGHAAEPAPATPVPAPAPETELPDALPVSRPRPAEAVLPGTPSATSPEPPPAHAAAGAAATPVPGPAAGGPAATSAAHPATAALPRAEAQAPLAVEAGARRTASARAVQAQPSPPPDLSAEVRAAEDAADVLRQIRLTLAPGVRRATIELVPAELGRLSIQVSLHEGRMRALVRAEDPRTLELLERQAPELSALLSEQGVEADTLELALGFDGGAGRGPGRRATRRIALGPPRAPDHASSEATRPHGARRAPGEGIDTYA